VKIDKDNGCMGAVARLAEMRNEYRILVCEHEIKSLLGRLGY
jgi:hypothetical protein